jgi:hypothetical protein
MAEMITRLALLQQTEWDAPAPCDQERHVFFSPQSGSVLLLLVVIEKFSGIPESAQRETTTRQRLLDLTQTGLDKIAHAKRIRTAEMLLDGCYGVFDATCV